MSFTSKAVIVTGASSGIGASTAIQFAKEGANVTVVGRNEERLNSVAQKCSKAGKEPLKIRADVSKEADARLIIKKTVDTFGKIDVLVNNAGIVQLADVKDEKLLKVFDTVINVNLRSVVMLSNFAAPYLIKTKGNIVNISSIAGSTVLGGTGCGYASYCTSKAALDQFTRLCAKELAEHGVRVNAISPGPVETAIMDATGIPVDWNIFKDNTALRVLTQPGEIADMILYLASDKARSITGANNTIDAGCLVNGLRTP